jgi:hypothetical protein
MREDGKVVSGPFWQAVLSGVKWTIVAPVEIPNHALLTDDGCQVLRRRCRQECGALIHPQLSFEESMEGHRLVSCALKIRSVECEEADLDNKARPLEEKQKRVRALFDSELPPQIGTT